MRINRLLLPTLLFTSGLLSAEAEPVQRIVVDRAEVGIRGRYLDAGPHAVTQRDLHYKYTGRFTFNLTRGGGVFVRLRAETGDAFNNDHNYTAVGLGQKSHTLNIKNVLLGWHVGERLEFQVGGIDYDPGIATQATYADNDGWLEGYRLVWRPAGLPISPDRVSLTAGYVGDFRQPNFFQRSDRMAQFNYFQILAEKRFTAQTAASVDVSGFTGVPYLRFGLKRDTRPFRLIDDISVEAIVRAARNRSFGWSSTASRRLGERGRPRLSLTYSDVSTSVFDRNGVQLVQNGDSMGLGKRLGATLSFSPAPNWEIVAFASRRLDSTPGVRNRAQLAVRYQLAGLLNTLFANHLHR